MKKRIRVSTISIKSNYATVHGRFSTKGLPDDTRGVIFSNTVIMPVTREEAMEFEPDCIYEVTFELVKPDPAEKKSVAKGRRVKR